MFLILSDAKWDSKYISKAEVGKGDRLLHLE